MKITPTIKKYIHHWGEMGIRWGTNRSVAQIQALLYLSPNPLTNEEISIEESINGIDDNLNHQTGTIYVLSSSDNGKVVTLNNESPIIVTIPIGLGDGFNCQMIQKGLGQVTIQAASGVNFVNRSGKTKTAGQYATLSVINIGSEAYVLSGDTGS